MSAAVSAPRQLTIAECDKIICRPGTPWEIETVVIDGLEQRVWKNGPPTFRFALTEGMIKFKDREFLDAPLPEPAPKDQRECVTFGQVHGRAVALAAWLRARGVRVGTRVGLVGYNSIGWVTAFTAIHLLGAVPVMVNASVKPDAMVHCLSKTKPPIVLADAQSAAILQAKRGALNAGRVGEVYAWSPAEYLGRNDVKDIDFANLVVSSLTMKEVINGADLEELTPDSDGVVFFTSGTTGYPKAVLSSQRAALHNITSGTVGALRAGLRGGASLKEILMMVEAMAAEQDVGLMAIPFFHVTGCLSWLLRSYTAGVKLVLMRRWSVDDAVDLIIANKVNVMGGVPAIATAILQSPRLPRDIKMKGVSYGGAAASSRLADDVKKRWPDAGNGQGWGMTETNALHNGNSGPDYVVKPKSVGPTIAISDVRIWDPETNQVLPPNTVGEIQARGPNIMKEYIGDIRATAAAIDKDGWLSTGDAGYIDDEGFLFISDRIKDIIIRGGENIASEEVENAIYLDDRIAEAAAVPVPDDLMGELVAVAVSLAPGAKATPQEVIDAASKRLRSHARPVFVWISDEPLPRNVNGKAIKTDIKKTVQALYQKSKQRQAKL